MIKLQCTNLEISSKFFFLSFCYLFQHQYKCVPKAWTPYIVTIKRHLTKFVNHDVISLFFPMGA